MKIVKCLFGIFIVGMVVLSLYAVRSGTQGYIHEVKAEAAVETQKQAVEVQKQEVERQADLDLIKARTEWYRNNTGAEQ